MGYAIKVKCAECGAEKDHSQMSHKWDEAAGAEIYNCRYGCQPVNVPNPPAYVDDMSDKASWNRERARGREADEIRKINAETRKEMYGAGEVDIWR